MELREVSAKYLLESVPQATKDEAPPGYKRTEVGVIPEDWGVSTLGAMCLFENGDRSINYPSPGSFVSEGIPFINAGHLAGGLIDTHSMDYITQAAFDRLRGGKVHSGDILFCLRGTLGKFGVIGLDFGDGAIASSLVIVRPRNKSTICEFIACYFASDLCSGAIEKWAGGAAQPNLGAQDLARFSLPTPPASEQRAIAATLSDTDELITALQQLIKKKRAIKQGAMQELLTGRRRLPGFDGEWKEQLLGEVAEIDPENLSAGTNPDFHFNYIALEDVHVGTLCSYVEHFFEVSPSRARRVLRDGDVLISTVRPTLQSHFLFRGFSGDWVCSTGFSVARCTNTVIPEFIFALLFSSVIGDQINALLTGSSYPAISSNDVRMFNVPIPETAEQTAIATILSDMDAEIEALETRLAKTRALKAGMMQQLLTGRIRLV